MSCNCKNGKSMSDMLDENSVSKNNKSVISKYALKTIAFSIFVLLSPIIFVFLLWFGFKVLVLNTSVDIKPMLSYLAEKIKEKSKQDDDYVEENFDANDYILTEVEDITNKN
jgi:hypothetical protein